MYDLNSTIGFARMLYQHANKDGLGHHDVYTQYIFRETWGDFLGILHVVALQPKWLRYQPAGQKESGNRLFTIDEGLGASNGPPNGGPFVIPSYCHHDPWTLSFLNNAQHTEFFVRKFPTQMETNKIILHSAKRRNTTLQWLA